MEYYVIKDYTSQIYKKSLEDKIKYILEKQITVIQSWINDHPWINKSAEELIQSVKISYTLEEENLFTLVNRMQHDVYRYTSVKDGIPTFSWDSWSGSELPIPSPEEITAPVERSLNPCLILLGKRIYLSGVWDFPFIEI